MWQKHGWRVSMAILSRVSLKGSSKVFCSQAEAQAVGETCPTSFERSGANVGVGSTSPNSQPGQCSFSASSG